MIRNVRYAFRLLWKGRGVTTTIIVTIALGVGANTAIFTLLDTVMFRPLPVQEPERLVLLKWTANKQPKTNLLYMWPGCPDEPLGEQQSLFGRCSLSYPMFTAIRDEQSVFSDVAAFVGPASINSTINGQGETSKAEFISGNFFRTLGVQMTMGRPLDPSDDQPKAQPAVVIGNSFWETEFGRDPSVIGRTILLKGTPFTIVGVAPPRFQGLTPGTTPQLWLPFSSQTQLAPSYWPKQTDDRSLWVQVFARLQRRVRLAQAQSALNATFDRWLNPLFPIEASPRIQLQPIGFGLDILRQEFRAPLVVLMTLASIILLIACANIAGLMLVRSLARQRETAIRLALGGRRSQILQQLLAEGFILTAIGATLGIFMAFWAARSIATFFAANQPSLEVAVVPDSRMLVFTVVISVTTGIVFSLVPGLAGIRLTPSLTLGQPASENLVVDRSFSSRAGKVLVVAQIALSILGLAGAGLLVRTLINLEKLDMGFDAQNVLIFNVSTGTSYQGEELTNLFQDLQKRFAAIPGVASASYSNFPLLSGARLTDTFSLPFRDATTLPADLFPVGPGFFETMRISLLRGRTFQAEDLYAKSHLAVINRAFAKQFGRDNPIGKHVTQSGDKSDWEIIGIVADAKYDDLRREVAPTFYFPLKEQSGSFELRATEDPKNLIPVVRSVVEQVDKQILLQDIQTMTEEIQTDLYQERIVALLSSIFGLLALALACLGLYGLLSYDAVRRTREIGTRIALGARQHHVMQLILARGVRLAALGIVAGIGATLVFTRVLRALLYGVSPVDPLSLAIAASLLLAVGLLACYIPAHRAAEVDPIAALRCE